MPDTPTPEPAAEPTTSGRVLHLFLVPLAIVVLLVAVMLLFGYLGYVGQTARDHVEQLRHPSRVAWQSAASLSQMLRDPSQSELRQDRQLAQDLAAILEEHLAVPSEDERHVNLRVFLCRALGEFDVIDGLPVLLRASSADGRPEELPVRLAALEAISVLADHQTELLVNDPELSAALIATANESSTGELRHEGELVRERAAFALGVLGSPAALEQLALMLDDSYPNVSFNAATGLARHGDARSIPVLVRMLDPENPAILSGESDKADARAVKQTTVLVNALRASRQLAAHHTAADVGPLLEAIRKLDAADVEPAVHREAESVLRAVSSRP
jgi:hypothetical protein